MRFANFPFAPARSPFFYGWVIVAASTLGTILSIPGQTMGVGAFTDSLIADLRISREDLSSAYMYGTVTSACVLPLAGRAFDVLGARILVVSSSLSLAATLVFLSVNETVTTWVAKHALPEQDRSTLSFGVLCCGFFFVRFWGQGVLTMSSRAMLGKWFDRRRGFASGLSGIFVSASFASAPVLLIWRIDSLGWRGAWVELAGICTVWAVIAWILCRDNPEECGLLMDGEEPTNRDDTDGPPEISRDFTLVDALRTPAFWIPAISLGHFGMFSTGMTFHITSIGAKVDLSKTEAASVFWPMAVFSTASHFISGRLSETVRVRSLLMALVLGVSIATVALLRFDAWWGRGMISLGLGLAAGLFTLLMTVLWPRFFGRAHLGAISGANMSISVLGSALGPKLFAIVEARTGSYDRAYFIGLGICALLFVSCFWLRNPQRPQKPTEL